MTSDTGNHEPQRPPDRRRQRGYSLLVLVILALVASGGGYLLVERGGSPHEEAPLAGVGEPEVEVPAPPETEEISGSFGRNQTFASVMAQHGMQGRAIYEIVESARPIYDLAKISAGRPYWLTLTAAKDFHDFRYPVDDERYLTIYKQGESYVPVLKFFSFEARLEGVSSVIQDSLFLAVKGSGEQEQLALDLADIFMWDVDFYSDIQQGDSFRLLVEKKFLDGRFVKYGAIAAASLTNAGKTFTGFRFTDAGGTTGYYDKDGRALRKSFLKSPLKFTRITSRFSHARRHPILKIVRPHLGVDYAAPRGTPVVAVGSGTVVSAGRNGGSGKMVRLRHARGFETYYLHLSRIAVRRGTRVSQGDVIGYVGATGFATAPHLDFRVTQNGKFVNPTKVVFPPAPPVHASAMPAFAAARDALRSQLESAEF